MPDTTYLWLIPAIIGYTAAIENQLPGLANLKPFIALAVAAAMYFGSLHLSPALFGLLFAVGSSMGVYTSIKTIGTTNITTK